MLDSDVSVRRKAVLVELSEVLEQAEEVLDQHQVGRQCCVLGLSSLGHYLNENSGGLSNSCFEHHRLYLYSHRIHSLVVRAQA